MLVGEWFFGGGVRVVGFSNFGCRRFIRRACAGALLWVDDLWLALFYFYDIAVWACSEVDCAVFGRYDSVYCPGIVEEAL